MTSVIARRRVLSSHGLMPWPGVVAGPDLGADPHSVWSRGLRRPDAAEEPTGVAPQDADLRTR